MDDRRVGLIVRALRRRRGWRQQDLAAVARVSQSLISRVERGHLSSLSLDALRRILHSVEARGELDVRWRGGELDRLMDEAHAHLGSLVASLLAGVGWRVIPEVTFMRLGERGSIDLLGINEEKLAAMVVELKSELTSYEQMQRRLDAKARVAMSVIEERIGWRPRYLAVVLVLSDTSSNRSRSARLAPLFRASLPAGNVAITRWLKEPSGNLSGVWFLRDRTTPTTKCRSGGPHRVRRPVPRLAHARRID